MLLPKNVYPELQIDDAEIPSKTYRLDTVQKRIVGWVDDLDAMLQAVQKIFATERFAWEIYSQNYGIELESLVGKDFEFVEAILESRIQEALSGDDRFLQLENFQVERVDATTLASSCTIVTTIGKAFFRKEWILQ